jgi:hypothetical protein
MTLARDHAVDHDLAAGRRHGRQGAPDGLGVQIVEARRVFLRLLLRVVLLVLALFLLHDGRDDDVVGAQQLHLREDLLLGTVADGEHRDHGGDAEEDAERREAGAQFVVHHGLGRDAPAEQHVRDESPHA